MPSAADKSIIIIGDGAVFLILLYPKCVSHRMAKTPSVNFKNRNQVVFVIIPFENHIVGSCTNNAYGDQQKSKIVYMLLVDAGFSASVYRQSKAKHRAAGDNESVPSDIQPFNSEKIFYCISV